VFNVIKSALAQRARRDALCKIFTMPFVLPFSLFGKLRQSASLTLRLLKVAQGCGQAMSEAPGPAHQWPASCAQHSAQNSNVDALLGHIHQRAPCSQGYRPPTAWSCSAHGASRLEKARHHASPVHASPAVACALCVGVAQLYQYQGAVGLSPGTALIHRSSFVAGPPISRGRLQN